MNKTQKQIFKCVIKKKMDLSIILSLNSRNVIWIFSLGWEGWEERYISLRVEEITLVN